jgi:hypothetical protein
MPPALIIGGAALAGAAGSVISSNNNKKAIEKSTDASLQANRESIASQEKLAAESRKLLTDQFNQSMGYNRDAYNTSGQLQTDVRNQNVAILNPWAQGGFSAFNQANALLGLPEQQAYSPQAIQFKPLTAPPPPAATPQPTTPTTPAPQPAPQTVQQPGTVPGNIANALLLANNRKPYGGMA